MFGNFIRATNSLITTTSENLFRKSSENANQCFGHLAEVVKSEAVVAANIATGVLKVGLSAATIGTGVLAAGSIVGFGYTITGVIGLTNIMFGSTTLSAVQSAATKAIVFAMNNSTATVGGTAVLHSILNGKMLVDGVSDIASATKDQFDAIIHLAQAAKSITAATSYTVAGVGLKVIEGLAQCVGSDQDGFGESSNLTFVQKDIVDPQMQQQKQDLEQNKTDAIKTSAVIQKSIDELTDNNEIAVTTKNALKSLKFETNKIVENCEIKLNHINEITDISGDWCSIEIAQNGSLDIPVVGEADVTNLEASTVAAAA
ncbi:MAG: hypothetical protein EOP33_03120 [Rickettsiaceae bacterium]|nr:MAG: hypothetical protein EOP33_03120 [Rickettsiaceae bacterium]